jgi:WD40 repeat protein
LAFTPGSAEIVLALSGKAGAAAEVRRYAVATLTRLETIATPVPAFALAANVPGMAIIGDGGIIMRSVDGTKSVSWLVDHTMRSLALSPDGSRLAVFGAENGTLRRTGTGEVIAGLNPQQGQVRAPVFSSDGKILAAGCAGQAVAVFNGETGKPQPSLRGHTGEVLGLAIHPHTFQILSGSNDHTARLWPRSGGVSPHTEIIAQRDGLAAVTADGSHLLGEDTQGRVFCSRPGGMSAYAPADHPRRALAITGSGGSIRFLTSRIPGPVLEWWHADATPDGAPVPLSAAPAKLHALTASSDGRLAAVSDNRHVTLCDTRTGQVLRTLPPSPVNIESLRLSADGSLLIAREYPRHAAVADTATGQWLWGRERLTSGTLGPMIFSPDNTLLVTGADDAVITIRRARTGEILTTLREHLAEIGPLAFTPDARTLASAGKDRTLRLWHVPTWRPLGPLRRDILCAALLFTPRGLYAAEYERRWLLLRGE